MRRNVQLQRAAQRTFEMSIDVCPTGSTESRRSSGIRSCSLLPGGSVGTNRMCHAKETAMRCRKQLERRDFLKLSGAATAAGLLPTGLVANLAHGDALTKQQRDNLTPDQIIALMKKGNERFRLGKESPHNYLAQQRASAHGQYPAAIILSCIDSRAPAETIMDLGIGDCFNARVAGNVANDDIIGSAEFACKLAGAKVLVVMGHTACGAVKGAIDDVELGHLTALLGKVRRAVSATEYQGERSAKNYSFVDAVARRNVAMTLADMRDRSAVLSGLVDAGAIKMVGAMYNLESGVLEFFE
jgi:carbonic anhydrase